MSYVISILLLSGTLVVFAGLLLLVERRLLNYGTCRIRIEGRPDAIEGEGGQDLLSALSGEGIYVPSLCGRRGTCGYCRVTVLSGGEPVLPAELLYLSSREIEKGTRLACQVKVRGDLQVRLNESLLQAQRYHARVSSVLPLTATVREIRLRLLDPSGISFHAGQYIQVAIPLGEDQQVWRAYSLASPTWETTEPALDVELVPGGVGSSYLHQLQPGDEVTFTGPYGEFKLNEDPNVEILCVAGGCGLAPMKSIIYTVLERWPERKCLLFNGIRNSGSAFHVAAYQKLAQDHPQLSVVVAVSDSEREAERAGAKYGMIHDVIQRELAPGVPRQAFVCGPEEMVDAVCDVLEQKGVKDIWTDHL